MKNRKLIKIIGIGLITSLLSGNLNVEYIYAATASKNAPKQFIATVKELSGDWMSGYYVVYEVNGHEYRSDRMGTRYNQLVWDELSQADRYKLLLNFTAVPKELKKQFGEEKTADMMKWYEDYSGLTEARQILKDRIANREFPTLTYFYKEQYEVRANVELPETAYALSNYRFLPEVRDYLKIDDQMLECYNTGKSAYRILVNAKQGQISTAIKGLSAVMIKQLICDRVLVPAISPGGLGALVPEIKGELWNIYDNISNTTEGIYKACGLGDWPDGKSARKIIDNYWVVINGNEKYATVCMDKFMKLKAQKPVKYEEAIAAIDKYVEDCSDKDREKQDEMRSDDHDPGLTPPKTDITTRLSGETDEEFKDRIIKELQREEKDLIDEYNEWDKSVSVKATEESSKISKIAYDYPKFTSDEYPGIITGMIDTGYYEYLLRFENYPDVTNRVPAAVEDALAQVDEYIGKVDSYETEYNALFEQYSSELDSYESRIKGLSSALKQFGGTSSRETFTSRGTFNGKDYYSNTMVRFYEQCGRIRGTDADGEPVYFTFDQLRDMMKERKSEINERKELWDAELEAFINKYKRLADEYAKVLELEEQAARTYEQEDQIAKSLLAESEQTYFKQEQYSVNTELQSDELKEQYDSLLKEGNAAGLSALCESWGDDLGQKMDRWQAATAKRNEAKNELIRVKRKAESILRTVTGSSDNFDIIVDFFGKVNNTSYKYYNDVAPGYAAGRDTTYAKSDDPELAGAMYRSYVEFGDCNCMALEYDLYYSKMLQHKPNYMRGIDSQDKLLKPYHDGDGPLRVEPGVIPLYGSYYNMYKYTAPIWVGVLGMTGTKGEEKALQLFDEKVKGSWRYEFKHGYVPVTGLVFSDESTAEDGLSMEPGEVKDLTALVRVLPENASDKVVFWESDNPEVIMIDENGVGTAVGEGMAVLTARARDSAFVENDDGTVTYTPAPLTFTVTVGEGVITGSYWNTDSTWKNYGTEGSPKLYRVKMLPDRKAMVTCSVSSVTSSEAHIVVALFDDEGTMLASEILPYTYTPGYRTVSLIADVGGGLNLKAFAVRADETYAPLDGVLLINEKISEP